MALAKFTDIVILLDASQSMLHTAGLTRQSLVDFINNQKLVEGEANLTIVEFSERTHYKYLAANVPVKSFDTNNFVYHPLGWHTALHDAWARLIDERGARYAALPESSRPEKVIFVVITDGQDNQSATPLHIVQGKVSHQDKVYGWEFVYLGANQKAEEVAKDYGIGWGQSMSYAADSISMASASLNNYVTRSRGMGAFQKAAFTAEDKSKALGKDDSGA